MLKQINKNNNYYSETKQNDGIVCAGILNKKKDGECLGLFVVGVFVVKKYYK